MSSRIIPVPIEEIYRTDQSVIRSGVIPYTVINNEIFWLMGIDRYGRLGDFGGGCRSSKKETAYSCCLREIDEESSGLLTKQIESQIRNKIGVFVWRARSRKDPPIYRYLLFVPIIFQDVVTKFKPNYEVFALQWIRQNEVLNSKVDIYLFLTSIRPYIRHFIKVYKKSLNLFPQII